MMTKEEAKFAVQAELESRKLTKRRSPSEMMIFCAEMYGRLEFRSKDDRLSDIRGWAERWQSIRFPPD
jgi:hypothetical protein